VYNGVTEAFQSKLAEPSRTFQARLINTANSGEVINDGFFSIKSYAQSNENNETISLGGTVSTYIEVEIYQPVYMVTGKEYEYQIGLGLDDGTFEYVPIGQFTAQKPKDDDGKVTFTAYDRFVSRLGHLFASELTYPAEGKTILNEIQTKSGVSIANISSLPDGVLIPKRTSVSEADDNGNTSTTYVNPFDGFSYRETIGYLALLYGKFATINRNGAVELRWYTDSGYRVGGTMSYDDIVCAETAFEVKYVQCTIGDDSKNPLISGSGATGISASAPVMTQALLDGIYGKVGGMKFLPTTLTYQGDPRLELGDIITVVKRDGTEVKVPVMMLNLDYDGGLINEVGSYGDTEHTSDTNDVGPATKRMDRVYSDLLLVKEVVASKASIAYLQANYANITELDAEKARIETLESNQVTTSYLKANFADISLCNIENGTIKNAMIDTGAVKTAQIADGSITDAKIVELTANKINTGTLSVERLEIVGSNSSLVYALNNSGDLTSATVNTLDGDVLTPRSITADKVVANAITAKEIASQTITANEIASNAITADKINVKDLFSGNIIATGTITGLNLKSAYIESTSGIIGGFTIGNTAIYNGTNSETSTINGIYIGTGKLRSVYTGNNWVYTSNMYAGQLEVVTTNTSNNYVYKCWVDGTQIGSSLKRPGITNDASIVIYPSGIEINNSTGLRDFYYNGAGNKFSIDYSDVAFSGNNFYVQNTVYIGNATYGKGRLYVGGYVNPSYTLSTESFICGSWIRTVGETGWYNETYGGGWWMTDSTYIRNFNSKPLLLDADINVATANIRFGGNAQDAFGVYNETSRNALRYNAGGDYLRCYRWNDANKSGITVLDNAFTLGYSNSRFKAVYAATGAIQTSDRNYKEDIQPLNSNHLKLFMKLVASSFRFKDGTSNRRHYGFIAQDVENAMLELGMSTQDFAGLCKDVKTITTVNKDGSEIETPVLSKDGTPEYIYSLRYDEFVSLETLAIQTNILELKEYKIQNDNRIESDEQQIRELQNRLYNLQFAFEQLKIENEQLKQAVA
jgi:hypothetical protein